MTTLIITAIIFLFIGIALIIGYRMASSDEKIDNIYHHGKNSKYINNQ